MKLRLAPTRPVHLIVGLTVWAVWFVAIYGGLAVGCNIDPPPSEYGALNWINLGIAALTLPTLALLAVLGLASWKARIAPTSPQRFCAYTGAGLYLTAFISTVAVGLPAVVLPPCL